MTDELRERVVRLETRQEIMDKRQTAFETKVFEKLDNIESLLSMGKGGWKAVGIMGSVLIAVASAAAWIYDHFFHGSNVAN